MKLTNQFYLRRYSFLQENNLFKFAPKDERELQLAMRGQGEVHGSKPSAAPEETSKTKLWPM